MAKTIPSNRPRGLPRSLCSPRGERRRDLLGARLDFEATTLGLRWQRSKAVGVDEEERVSSSVEKESRRVLSRLEALGIAPDVILGSDGSPRLRRVRPSFTLGEGAASCSGVLEGCRGDGDSWVAGVVLSERDGVDLRVLKGEELESWGRGAAAFDCRAGVVVTLPLADCRLPRMLKAGGDEVRLGVGLSPWVGGREDTLCLCRAAPWSAVGPGHGELTPLISLDLMASLPPDMEDRGNVSLLDLKVGLGVDVMSLGAGWVGFCRSLGLVPDGPPGRFSMGLVSGMAYPFEVSVSGIARGRESFVAMSPVAVSGGMMGRLDAAGAILCLDNSAGSRGCWEVSDVLGIINWSCESAMVSLAWLSGSISILPGLGARCSFVSPDNFLLLVLVDGTSISSLLERRVKLTEFNCFSAASFFSLALLSLLLLS